MVLHGWIILLTFALSNRSYMEDRYIIYLHVNKINNKVYVGITKHSNPELRWRHGREYRKNVVFTRALDKYGWDGFEHIVLFRNLPKEIACKKKYKSISEANMSFNKEASRPDISRACRDSTKSAYGYRWRYERKEVNNG